MHLLTKDTSLPIICPIVNLDMHTHNTMLEADLRCKGNHTT